MEQKRTLWIVAAVGVFLLVVLGAALILYAPAAKPAQTVASSRGMNNGTASNGWISLAPAGSPVTTSNESMNAQQISEDPFDFNTEEKTTPGAEFRTDEINIYAENANVYSEKTDLRPLGNNAQVTTIDLTATAQNKTAQAKEPVPPAAVAKAGPAKTAAKTAEKTSVTSKPVEKSTAKTVAVKQTSAPAKKQTVAQSSKSEVKAAPAITQYWVQVTALTSRKSADAAREKLGENQITADVFTYTDNKNQLYYRVRVGPYTTKSEAEYWRTKIAKIDTFKNTSSYVTSTQVTN